MKNAQHSNGREHQVSERAQKWAELLQQFHRSGQTRKAFARQQGVALATLSYWLTREKRRALAVIPSPMVFSELSLSAPDLRTQPVWAMEVVSPTGLTVRSREALPVRVLTRLLRSRGC